MPENENAKQSTVVLVYRDDTKAELLAEVPIIDLGIETGETTSPAATMA